MTAQAATRTLAPRTRRSRLAPLAEAHYKARQAGMAALSQLFMRVLHAAMKPGDPLPPLVQRRRAIARFQALLDVDLANVRAGRYPRSLLFSISVREHLRVLPQGLRDIPRVIRRARRKAHDDLPPSADLARYPRYYQRTFHWQTDGWLSERSAKLYDPGVELLFGGMGDAMRRQIIPDLQDHTAGAEAPTILDVACGTARFLRQLRAGMPTARLIGLDLSPHYLKHARETLADVDDVSLIAGNAEAMPLGDATVDAASCIYLFHELPKDARRNVLRDIHRVLKPGGVLAICASPQYVDSSDIKALLDRFPRYYHEPYYKGYLRDPLEDALAECGFEVLDSRAAFVSKLVIARRLPTAAVS